ncbi:ankyrin-3-like [Physella acuta]|uniref:ankyrin-3-like n=1 Tax=Physella acuta TaxID=109671 RepID=UPI0027DBDC91|nr:ankyrin-3-like [Physella acuta]
MLQVVLNEDNTEVAELLISSGANPNNVDFTGQTALKTAFRNSCKNFDLIKLLLEKGADVNHKPCLGERVLNVAVYEGNLDLVKLLLQHKAEVNLSNKCGNTEYCTDECSRFGRFTEPLVISAANQGNMEIMKALMKHGIDLDVEFNETNALLTSVDKNDEPMYTLLIENGAELDSFNSNGETALFMAAKSGNLGLARLLIMHGADVDILNSKKISALFLAVELDQPEMVKLLVQAKAALDTSFYSGNTALHIAVKHKRVEMTQVLTQAWAEVNKVNDKGRTPLMYALKFGHLECTQILLQHGADANIRDITGRIALAFALDNRERFYQHFDDFVQCIKVVLDFTKDIHMVYRLRENRTTILISCIKLECFKVFAMLQRAGADLEQVDDQDDTPLLAALRLPVDKQVDFVKVLLFTGAKIDVTNNLGQTPLFLAVKNNNLDIIKLFVREKAELNTRFPKHVAGNSGTVLHLAVINRSVEIVQYLTTLDIDVNLQNDEGKTALILAAELGLSECVVALLKAKTDVNIRDAKGCNALAYAINGRSPELNPSNTYLCCVKELLDYSSDVNVQYKIDDRKTSPLMDSIRLEYMSYVDLLLKARADLELTDERGETILMAVIMSKQRRWLEFAKRLVRAGANVNVVNSVGKTPLEMSIRRRNFHLVKLILQSGADLKDVKDNVTCLHESSRQGNAEIVELMIQLGVDVNSRDKHGQTAVMVAGNTECLHMLIKSGCDVNKTDHKGRNAVMLASRDLKVENLKVLISSGADVIAKSVNGKPAAIKDVDGNTSLHLGLKCFEITKVLLQAGVDPDAVNRSGKTPLLLALEDYCFDTRVLSLLILHGANVNKRDREGSTALMIAVQRGNPYKIQILLEAGAEVIQRKDFGAQIWAVCLARNYSNEHLDLMVKAGVDISSVNEHGETGLMLAVKHSRIEAIQFFMAVGDLDKTDARGRSALMYTTDESIQKILLEAGVSVNLQDYKGKTCLMKAAKNENTNIETYVELYSSYGLNMHVEDNKNRTALYYVFKVKPNNHSTFFMINVMFLLKNGISPLMKINSSEFKTTVFDKIMREIYFQELFSNKIEMIRLFVCNGFYVLLNGSSILCQALNVNKMDIVKYCLANCYLNLKDLKLLKEKESYLPANIKPALSEPWPLVKLALITVSSHMGYGAERIDRVKRSELPTDLQDALLFNTPVARLPTNEWSTIPLNFDPKIYDELETPRQYLSFWPVDCYLKP